MPPVPGLSRTLIYPLFSQSKWISSVKNRRFFAGRFFFCVRGVSFLTPFCTPPMQNAMFFHEKSRKHPKTIEKQRKITFSGFQMLCFFSSSHHSSSDPQKCQNAFKIEHQTPKNDTEMIKKSTLLHFTSLHFSSLHCTSLHFTSLHFTSLLL